MPPRAVPKGNLTEIIGKLSSDGKLIVSALMIELKEIRLELECRNDEISDLKTEITDLRQEIRNKDKNVEALSLQVTHLKKTVTNLENKLDEVDAYERQDTLIFSGTDIPDGSPNENSGDVIVQTITEKLRIQNISSSSISTAHRLGKRNPGPTSVDKRPIIVKFCHRETKRRILTAARRLKSSGLYVNESLTPLRRQILYAVRQIKRSNARLVKGCSTHDGKVLVYTLHSTNAPEDSPTTKRFINTYDELKFFCDAFIKKPLEEFVENFRL